MKRRTCLLAALAAPLLARAHHGWSSFDQDRPVYLQGKVASVTWQNPHAEFMLELPPDYKLPADLAGRALPAQSAGVDGKALLAKAVAPTRKDRRWQIELAPLTRMQAWKVVPLQAGGNVGVLGFTFKEEKGEPIVRAEYLFVDGKVYGLRSSPV
ncbi:MAG: hypothetical protein JWP65_2902 [Ramlibacter sp.]|uniref:DUF6152 family protein n=1 Tax=Ramlibacter sp. TaxID=1917967 RepID=UPI002624D076|nr:DUF6152 family protein [Ramlibacter sp.]MDB5752481.1 hypothetical protein [Ramlibacter sp.]